MITISIILSLILALLISIIFILNKLSTQNIELQNAINNLKNIRTNLTPVFPPIRLISELNWSNDAHARIAKLEITYDNTIECIEKMHKEGIKKEIVCRNAEEYIRKYFSSYWHYNQYEKMVKLNLDVANGKLEIEEALKQFEEWPRENEIEIQEQIKDQLRLIEEIYKK
jgi:hypothetical protein